MEASTVEAWEGLMTGARIYSRRTIVESLSLLGVASLLSPTLLSSSPLVVVNFADQVL